MVKVLGSLTCQPTIPTNISFGEQEGEEARCKTQEGWGFQCATTGEPY